MCYGRGAACRKQLLEACDLGVAVLAWTEVAPKTPNRQTYYQKHVENPGPAAVLSEPQVHLSEPQVPH